jgi:hypothetical protein
MADCSTNPPFNCPSPSNWAECRPWDLANGGDNCFIESQLSQAVEVAGAKINVHKLLGVHEQTKLLDLTGNGTPISNGSHPSHPASNAFTKFDTYWESSQSGADVISKSFIGYDFGNVKLPSGRERYAVPAAIRYNIATLAIKQGDKAENRVTKARVERSDNGTEWYGVAIVNLPDNSNLNTVSFKQSVPSRFWRLRPLQFAGSTCVSWVVKALEFHEYAETEAGNIQDRILFENRDRDYMESTIELKGYYEIQAPMTFLTRFAMGINTTTYQIRIPFSTAVARLNRPIIIGDILELPSETQYSRDMVPIKRYLEVSDVTWDSTTYTPGWLPLMLLVTASPAIASQETQDIFGDLKKNIDNMGLFDKDDGNEVKYQDFAAISHTIRNDAASAVPQLGSEGSNTVREFTPEEIAEAAPIGNLNKLNFNRNQLYVEDAIPQNGADYTEGPDFPPNPIDLQYHRVTYEGAAKDVPARLYRYSVAKGQWVYLETDRRSEFNATKPIMQEYLRSQTAKPAKDIK